MRFPTLAAAVGLLSTAAEAAPRHRHVDEVEARYVKMGRAVGRDDAAVGVMPRSHNSTRIGSSNQTMSVPEGCPTGSVFVSTTTVDITIYVTPMANSTGSPEAASTEPCDEETTTTPAPSVEPCTDDVGSTTLVTPMTRGPFANSSVTTPRPTPEEPCETGLYVNSTAIYSPTKPPKIPMPTAPFSNRTAATEPCDETTTGHVPSIATGSASSHSTSLVTTMPPRASTTCVIDTSMTPVAKSTLSSTPAATVTPTKTVCEHDGETGTPSPDSAYCGIKGRPAGAYFIAEFVEDRPGVPVTEEGCYQFCNSVMEDAKGCRSYRYWPGHLGAPRCALYGMPVSYVVKDVDSSQPGKWYDLECGSPDAQSWLQQMSQHRQGKAGP